MTARPSASGARSILTPERFNALVDVLSNPAHVQSLPLPQAPAEGDEQGREAWLLALPEQVLLTATHHGKARFEQAGRDRAADMPPLGEDALRYVIDSRLSFHGDPSILENVVSALLVAPEYVREAALDDVAFLAVGRDSLAWISSSTFVDQDGRTKSSVIVLGPDVDRRIVLHEIGHAWHAPLKRGEAISTQGEAALLAHASEAGWLDRIHAHISTQELLADAHAFRWSRQTR